MFKDLTAQEAARLTSYLIGALVGAFAIVWGIVQGDAAMVALGAGLLGVSGVAAPNVTHTGGAAPVPYDVVADQYADDGEGDTFDLSDTEEHTPRYAE